MELEFYSIGVPSLVVVRQNFTAFTLFCTISPNPNIKITVRKKFGNKVRTFKQPYDKLPQRVQYDYCIRVLKTSYNYSKDTKIYGTWELNQKGNLHLHFLFEDPNINSETMLHILRRDVYNSELVRNNLSKSKIDYMNSIVRLNDSINDRYKYIHKDNNAHYLPYYSTCNLVPLSEVKPNHSLEHLGPSPADEGTSKSSFGPPIGYPDCVLSINEEQRLLALNKYVSAINNNT